MVFRFSEQSPQVFLYLTEGKGTHNHEYFKPVCVAPHEACTLNLYTWLKKAKMEQSF